MQFMHGGSRCLVYGGHPFTSLLHGIHFRMFKRGGELCRVFISCKRIQGGGLLVPMAIHLILQAHVYEGRPSTSFLLHSIHFGMSFAEYSTVANALRGNYSS